MSRLVTRMKEESSSSDEDHRLSSQADRPMAAASVCYKKTLRLTSEQLVCIFTFDFPQDGVFIVLGRFAHFSESKTKPRNDWCLFKGKSAAEGGSEWGGLQCDHSVSGHLSLSRNNLSLELGWQDYHLWHRWNHHQVFKQQCCSQT